MSHEDPEVTRIRFAGVKILLPNEVKEGTVAD